MAGDTTRLPLLACGLLCLRFYDFIGELRAPRYAGRSRCGFSIRYVAVHSTVMKRWTARPGTPCVPGGSFLAYQQRSSTGTPCYQMSGAAGDCSLTMAGIAVMRMDVAIRVTLIVICVLAALAITALRPSPCFRAALNASRALAAGAHDGTYARSIGTDLSVVVQVAGAKRVGKPLSRGRWCRVRIGTPLSHQRRCRAQPCFNYR